MILDIEHYDYTKSGDRVTLRDAGKSERIVLSMQDFTLEKFTEDSTKITTHLPNGNVKMYIAKGDIDAILGAQKAGQHAETSV